MPPAVVLEARRNHLVVQLQQVPFSDSLPTRMKVQSRLKEDYLEAEVLKRNLCLVIKPQSATLPNSLQVCLVLVHNLQTLSSRRKLMPLRVYKLAVLHLVKVQHLLQVETCLEQSPLTNRRQEACLEKNQPQEVCLALNPLRNP